MKQAIYTLLIFSCCFSVSTAQTNYLDNYIGATVTPTIILSDTNLVNLPRDLDFKPNTNELWVANYGTWDGGSTAIIYNAGLPNQTSEYRMDSYMYHFMTFPSAIAFGDDGKWASTSELQNNTGGTSTFMGPTLWTGDTAIYARVFQITANGFPLGSHYDMLHQSPFAMGIAHDSAMAYWVNDGHNGTICRYDYVQHHGPGYEDHSAGKIWRYIDVLVNRVPDVPSHMVLDKANGWLYFIDGGPKKIKRMNVNSGNVTGNLTPPSTAPETLASYEQVEGAVVEELDTLTTQPCGIDYYNDRLVVSDYTTGDIYLYNTSGAFTLLQTIVTGLPGMMGVKVGPDGRIWCVNNTDSKVYRLDIADPATDVALLAITSPTVQNFKPDYFSISFDICDGSITPAVTILNKGTNVINSVDFEYAIDNGTPVTYSWAGALAPGTTTSVSLPSTPASNGSHLLNVTAINANGSPDEIDLNNNIEGSFRIVGPPVSLPLSETFTAPLFPPAGWNYLHHNLYNKMSWETVGGFGTSIGSMKMDHFSGGVDITGQKDHLLSPVIDMTSATANTWLHFNVAYARYNASSNDALEVLVSTDCGSTWASVYYKSGMSLTTAVLYTVAFTPAASQWRTDSVSLAAFAGQSNVLFAFSTTSNFGNNLYVDDILVNDISVGIDEIGLDNVIIAYPNPVSSILNISLKSNPDENLEGEIYSADGTLVKSFIVPANQSSLDLDLSSLNSGVYAIRLTGGKNTCVKTIVKE